MNIRPRVTLTRIDPGPAPCLMCGKPAVWFAEYQPVDLTLCDACYWAAKQDGEPDDLDKAEAAFHHQIGAEQDENFVCTDVDGARHDLSQGCYYIVSRPEGSLYRINAGYWPDELEEEGFEACRQRRGYDPIEFLVTETEHARMMRDGVLDDVDGQSVGEALAERVDTLLHGQREN